MTRSPLYLSCLAPLAMTAAAFGQTYSNPSASSQYAPRATTAQAAQPRGQNVANQQTARTTATQGPVAQGQATQATAAQGQAVQSRATQGPTQNAQQPVRQVSGIDAIGEPVRRVDSPATPGQRPLGAPFAPAAPVQPGWIPLAPDHDKWVDQVLQFWEQRSNKIKAFSCKFKQWQYDAYAPPETPRVFAEGVIKYAQPDKGLYRVEKLSVYSPPAKAGEKATYVDQDATLGEHWVCDGQQIFAFDARNKKLIVSPLPPGMRGKAIADGPLPFLFGAKAEQIKARYWVRGLPEGGKGKYWLEAVPKSREDAQNFKMVHIVLDEKEFLPEMIQVFEPNYDPRTNPARKTYVFEKHEVTDNGLSAAQLIQKLNLFHREFYEPAKPAGWTKVVEGAGGVPALGPTAGRTQEATKPAAPRTLSPIPR